MVNVTEEGDNRRTFSFFKIVLIFFEVSIYCGGNDGIFGSFFGGIFAEDEFKTVAFAKFFCGSIAD